MRARPSVLALAAAAVAIGCHLEEPFVRDNLWDDKSTATRTLTGPDSTFSIGDTFSLQLVTVPALPPGAQFDWSAPGAADTATQVFAAGDGKFIVTRAHAGYAVVSLAAVFDGAQAGWQVRVGQKLATFDLFCGSVVAPAACDATPLAVNGTRSVLSTMRDANTNDIRRRNEVMLRATIVSRDPSVLSTSVNIANAAGTFTVRGVAPGATWFVVTVDGVTDSVRVVVGP